MPRDIPLPLDRLSGFRQAFLPRIWNRQTWQAGGLLLLANIIVTGLGLVRTPVMTWMMPKEEIGMLGVIGAWMPFLQLLSLSGLDSATYHYVAKGHPRAFIVNILHRLRWSLLSTFGFLALAVYAYARGNPSLGWLFAISGITYPATVGLTAGAGMLAAQERFKGLFWYRIAESLVDFTGFIPLVLSAWWLSRVVTFFAANQAATILLQVGLSLWLVSQLRRSNPADLPPSEERAMVRYGKHLTAISGIGVLQARTDALLVGTFLPLGTMAEYSIALLVFDQFKRLWGVYVAVRYPPLVRMPVSKRHPRFILEGGLVWLSFIAFGILVAAAAHWLIPLVLPATYRGSLGYIDVLIAAVLAGMPGGLAETYFRTEQDEKRQYLMRTTAAVFGVAAPALLVFSWGAYGAALGRLVANLIFSGLGIWLFLRKARPLPETSL